MGEQIRDKTAGKLTKPVPFISLLESGKTAPGKNNIAMVGICFNKLNFSFTEALDITEKLFGKLDDLLRKKTPNNLPCVGPTGAFIISADKPEQMIELVKEAAGEVELTQGTDYFLVIDCRAPDFHSEVAPNQGSAKKGQAVQSTSKHRYEWLEGAAKPTEDMCDVIENLVESESVIAVIDPLHPEDEEGYARLSQSLSGKCHIFSRSSATLSTVVGFGETLSKTITAIASRENFASTLLETKSWDEGTDTVIADLAVAGGVGYTLFGGIRTPRCGLYNRLSQLEERGIVTNPALESWGIPEVKPPEVADEA